jgi:hypothetical protein
MAHPKTSDRSNLAIPLQVLSAFLLLFGWWSADRVNPPHSLGPPHRGDMILLAIWLAGSISAAIAWRICRRRRFLSGAELALNLVGVFASAFMIWGPAVEFH